jgi:hypothetical protein
MECGMAFLLSYSPVSRVERRWISKSLNLRKQLLRLGKKLFVVLSSDISKGSGNLRIC